MLLFTCSLFFLAVGTELGEKMIGVCVLDTEKGVVDSKLAVLNLLLK